MSDFNLSLKDKHLFAKEFTITAIQNNLIVKSPDAASTAKHVAAFYNTLIKELDKNADANA